MKTFRCLILILTFSMCSENKYTTPEMGLCRSEAGWSLTVWSSQAQEMELLFYDDYQDSEASASMGMKQEGSFWNAEFSEVQSAKFYTVRSKIDGSWLKESVEPYAKLVSVNGERAVVMDAGSIAPEGWLKDQFISVSPIDAIIYEIQVRDFSIGCMGCFKNPGKFLAFTEVGLTQNDQSIGIEHLKEMGVTHLHILPAFDFRSIDESKLQEQNYNWGYDPLNYNVPEGSFSTNPVKPETRVLEFKQMVMALHSAGIGVIMDVVYNHTGPTIESSFNQLDPGYYYRLVDGKFSNASACGNETASEKEMMRRFMIESMSYWMEHYHIDGFRVDLMGIHDIETMNQVKKRLKEINPDVLLYGEGWAAGESPLDPSLRALKSNTASLDDIAVFSDEFRDGLKGHWNTHSDRGFITGKPDQKENVKFGLVGGVFHSEVQYHQVNYSDAPWAERASQMISYISSHDGMTLRDKIRHSYPGLTDRQYTAKQKLAATLILTSQGIPFIHAGFEFLRSKQFVDNSFESPDSINAIDWSLKNKHAEVVGYVQSLIKMRKEHILFKLDTEDLINKNVTFPETNDELLLAYQIDASDLTDSWKQVLLLFNGDIDKKVYEVPEGDWYFEIKNGIFEEGMRLTDPRVELEGSSATILYQLRE